MATTDELIDGLAAYVCKRQIRIAEILACEFQNPCSTSELQESGFAILEIVLPYFEMIEQLITGRSSNHDSINFFVRGFQKVYPCSPLTDLQIRQIYGRIRCGLFHDGMTRRDTLISRYYTQGFQIVGGEIRSNPACGVQEIKNHFCCCYLPQLRTAGTCERQQFEAFVATLALDPCSTLSTKTPRTQNPADFTSYTH